MPKKRRVAPADRAERLKIPHLDWTDAVKVGLSKARPPEGWPKPTPRKKKSKKTRKRS